MMMNDVVVTADNFKDLDKLREMLTQKLADFVMETPVEIRLADERVAELRAELAGILGQMESQKIRLLDEEVKLADLRGKVDHQQSVVDEQRQVGYHLLIEAEEIYQELDEEVENSDELNKFAEFFDTW